MQPDLPARNSDRQLVEGLRRGDEGAARELVQRLAPHINRTVYRLTGWHADTQDLVQEVFLQIQQSAAKYRGECKIETWATSIAINCCRKWRRHQAVVPNQEHQEQNDIVDPTAYHDSTLHEDQEIIRYGLQMLTQEDRELIVLRYLEELGLDELTHLFNIKKNTLEVRLVRARKRLAEKIRQLENVNDRNERVQA